MGKKKKKGKARCQHTGPREVEYFRSLLDRLTLGDEMWDEYVQQKSREGEWEKT